MSSPVYYTIDGSPFTPAAIPLPPSPFHTPRGSPNSSPYGIHLIPLPPSPNSRYAAIPAASRPYAHTPPRNPIPLPAPPIITDLALGTEFTPHPLLQFNPENPKLIWDVRLPPSTGRIAENTPRFRRLPSTVLNQHALSPPWTFMRLKCDLLPWIVEVSNPSGVTVRDVLDALWECLREKIERQDWREATDDFRGRLESVWESRCKLIGDVEEAGRAARMREERAWIRRVDWLLWDFEWLGISKCTGEVETWEMKFRSR